MNSSFIASRPGYLYDKQIYSCFRLLFGMMFPTWCLSMWTNNMATTAMMCPIADALLKELEHSQIDKAEEKSRDFFLSCQYLFINCKMAVANSRYFESCGQVNTQRHTRCIDLVAYHPV